jgi:hypothetical protein
MTNDDWLRRFARRQHDPSRVERQVQFEQQQRRKNARSERLKWKVVMWMGDRQNQ